MGGVEGGEPMTTISRFSAMAALIRAVLFVIKSRETASTTAGLLKCSCRW